MTENPHDDLAHLLFTRKHPDAARDAVMAMVASAHRTLRMARSLADARRNVDLTGLDNMVGLVTAQMLDLEPADGRALRPELIGLMSELDGLSRALCAGDTNPS